MPAFECLSFARCAPTRMSEDARAGHDSTLPLHQWRNAPPSRHRSLLVLIGDSEADFPAHHLFERDTRGFMLLRININARPGAALYLLTSFSGYDYQAIF